MIIPVVDIKDGICVSGKSGKRDTYTELKSIYGENPLEIAENLHNKGAKLLYIADLDRIEEVNDNSKLICQINKIIPVLLDNGIKSVSDMEYSSNLCSYYILATETMESIEEIEEILKIYDTKRIVISIDVKNNDVLIKNNNIKLNNIIKLINRYKPLAVIVLNISNVGTRSQKNNTITKKVFKNTPDIYHICAGGITNKVLEKYNDKYDYLIGTILHDGTLEYEL